ncbi:MAG: DEAD/DEAH box helicase [Planctomycetaceae bacterium]|nr:DEAD/DEAH box helicase [Planctomycetaceae bacterium]
MSLAKVMEDRFRGDIRFRGAAYLQAERVAITRVTPDHVFGAVRDGTEFHTQLSRQNGELRMFCSCVGEGTTREPACKHLWATILAVDAGSLLAGAAVRGNVPAFAAAPESAPLSDPLAWEDDLEEDLLSTSRTATRTRPRKPAVQPKTRDWEVHLSQLRDEISTRGDDDGADRDREIFYEIDLRESWEAGELVVQSSQRQRRTSGQWGKLKPLKVRPGRLDDIEHEDDRRILAYLGGGTPERSGWYAQQAEFQSAVHRYRVPFDLAMMLLPMMCATGRVRVLDENEGKWKPLEWDDAPPWVLTICVRRSDDEENWKLEGELRRDKQIIRIPDARLIVSGGLVVTEQQIARVDDFGAGRWLKFLRAGQNITAKAGEEHELVEALLDMPVLPRLDLPEELKLEEVSAVPEPLLTVRTPRNRGWKHERLQGVVEFDYLGTRVSASSTQWAIVQRDQQRCVLRDREFESAAWARLTELGFRRLLDHRRGVHDVEIGASDLGRAVRGLAGAGWKVQADGRPVRQAGQLDFRVRSGIDWFELSGNVDFGGQSVKLPELLSALSRGDTTVRLDDGSLGIVPEAWLQQYGILAGLGQAGEDHVRFSTAQVSLLDALLSTQESVDVDERFLELRNQLTSFAGVKEVAEPAGFIGELRTYQREGLGWLKFLQTFHLGGCLADDMGLGKTVQMLAILEDRKQRSTDRRPSLIVVPKSLMFNWAQEIKRFTPNLSHIEYAGIDRASLRETFAKQDIILTTYGTLRRDIVHIKDVEFEYAVLDEAQTIKNASSQVAKAARLLQARHRVALSGTPIENHLSDLWSIFEFLNPGMLGRSSVFKQYASDAKDQQARTVLAHGLRPFVLRRTKQQVATELPDKFEETIYCRMGRRQQQLYDELREHYRDSLLGMIKTQGMGKSQMHVLEALLRLRQAACHPALLDRGQTDEPFAKLDILIPHLEELIEEKHKSLVFSQFTSMLAIVRQHLDKKGIRYAYLDGQTRRRKQVVDEFQDDPDVPIFLISLKAGGLGLNLTAAEYVFLLDPWWNPAVETQAIDRAHRVGQTNQVFAYRLICRDTVEEKILELQKQKRELADAILEEKGNMLRNLTAEDVQLLLS